jgi:cell wall-associated NlpC family hydrolase
MRRRSPWRAVAALTGAAVFAAPAAPAQAEPTDPPLAAQADLFLASSQTLPDDLVEEIEEHPDIEELRTVSAARLDLDGGELAVVGADPQSLASFTAQDADSAEDTSGSTTAQAFDALEDGLLVPAQETVDEGGLEPGESLSSADEGRWRLDVAEPAESALPGIAGFLSAETAEELGMPEANAALLSVSGEDAVALQEEITAMLPEASGVQLLPEAPGTSDEASSADTAERWDGDGLDPDTIEEAIAAAESKLGAPYVWGGSGPDVFDCSGLVQWAFAQAGVTLPRVTHEQWTTGPQIDYEEARRGDLLFWRSDPQQPDYISHVALYLGDGQMLEAPRRGEVVRVTDVRFSNFAGVVRISPE